MNNQQLEKLLTSVTGDVFCGVWASDHLPLLTQHFPLPAYFIVNTHPGHRPGEHWLALTLEKDGTATFFDSYGFPPDFHYYPSSILQFLKKRADKILYHDRQIQHPLSVACGHHCVFYLSHRFRGLSFDQVLSLYSEDAIKNDRKATALVKKFRCISGRGGARFCHHASCSMESFLNHV